MVFFLPLVFRLAAFFVTAFFVLIVICDCWGVKVKSDVILVQFFSASFLLLFLQEILEACFDS